MEEEEVMLMVGGGSWLVGEGKFAHLLKCIVVDNPQEIERGRARDASARWGGVLRAVDTGGLPPLAPAASRLV